jgi:hypothetical protein
MELVQAGNRDAEDSRAIVNEVRTVLNALGEQQEPLREQDHPGAAEVDHQIREVLLPTDHPIAETQSEQQRGFFLEQAIRDIASHLRMEAVEVVDLLLCLDTQVQ